MTALPKYSWLTGFVFFFSDLNILSHFLLVCKVSAEKSAVRFMRVPSYVRNFFCLIAFKILFVFNFEQFII